MFSKICLLGHTAVRLTLFAQFTWVWRQGAAHYLFACSGGCLLLTGGWFILYPVLGPDRPSEAAAKAR